MKYTLECSDEELGTYRLHLDGVKWALCMYDLDQELRSMYKYQDKEVVDISAVRDRILDILCDHGVSFEDIE